jgi:hypothetical protein
MQADLGTGLLAGAGLEGEQFRVQAAAAAVAGRPCGSRGRARARALKDTRHIVLRTLFGRLRMESPRYKADTRAQPAARRPPAR